MSDFDLSLAMRFSFGSPADQKQVDAELRARGVTAEQIKAMRDVHDDIDRAFRPIIQDALTRLAKDCAKFDDP